MKLFKNLLVFAFILSFSFLGNAQNNATAKKLYRNFNKYEQFKQAQIPKFVLMGARMFIKNNEVNSILKAVQKAKVLSVNNPKYAEKTNEIFNEFSNSLDNKKYKASGSQSKNLKIFTKEKNSKIKEIAIMNRTGPTLHYILIKGNLKKEESEKFLKNINNLGVNIDGLADKLMNELDKILNQNKQENTSQPKIF